jgi:hypothetical protein
MDAFKGGSGGTRGCAGESRTHSRKKGCARGAALVDFGVPKQSAFGGNRYCGGSQLPFTHLQLGPGWIVGHAMESGSQFPFTHVQSGPGRTVVQDDGAGDGAGAGAPMASG